jgi:tetratricopeptide (TPR) repeat protein
VFTQANSKIKLIFSHLSFLLSFKKVYVLLSELFHRLCDYEKSARYASKAYDLSRSLQLGDLNSRHHRAALLRMASALRKQGELGDARDYVEEATRLALISGDQATYTRSIRIMGDIYRKKLDIDVSHLKYVDEIYWALKLFLLFFRCRELLGNMNKQWGYELLIYSNLLFFNF